jgi:site-specific DNA-methyltransferase (adenine-specific)
MQVKTILINDDYKNVAHEMLEKGLKVDAIITDPPYCVSRNYQLGFSNMGRSGMDYGKWDYNFDQKEWIKVCAPLIKTGGSIIIFMDWKNLSYLVEELTDQGFTIKDLIRWEKKNPMPRNVNSRYVMDFEVAIWAVKGTKGWTFNKPANKPYLKPVYVSGVVLGGKKRIHPTQKSVDVIEEIIKVHTNIGDIVFDPFSGSGTTALACKKAGRSSVSTEIDKNYYDRSVVRLDGDISIELSW